MFPLKKLHTFKMDVTAKNVVEIKQESDLNDVVGTDIANKSIILGGGSNTVFSGDYNGTVLLNRLLGVDYTEVDNGFIVTSASGVDWHDFVLFCHNRGIFGLENLALIPGTVGACPVQNIGAYGVEVSSYIYRVHCVDLVSGEKKVLDSAQCCFSYRDSIFKKSIFASAFITQVDFFIPKGPLVNCSYGALSKFNLDTPAKVLDKVISLRQDSLPSMATTPNAGCFFKNPVVSLEKKNTLLSMFPLLPFFEIDKMRFKIPASFLIDCLGLKGFSSGPIAISSLHASFLINRHGLGCSTRLNDVVKYIVDTCADKLGIALELEVNII